jgi:uncharacterized protein YciI
MMHFIVLARDNAGAGERRQSHRQEHLDYWLSQGAALLVAGAMMSDDGESAEPVGSSYLLAAESEQQVLQLVAGDPFTRHGIFDGAPQVQRIRPAIGTLWPA